MTAYPSSDYFDGPNRRLNIFDIVFIARIVAVCRGEVSPNDAARIHVESQQNAELAFQEMGITPEVNLVVGRNPWLGFYSLIRDDPELVEVLKASYRRGVDKTAPSFRYWPVEQVEEWRRLALAILEGSQRDPFSVFGKSLLSPEEE